MTKSQKTTQKKLSRTERRRNDFPLFLNDIWQNRGLPMPTYPQLIIADFLAGPEQQKCINAYRMCAKTWITAAYCLWRLDKDPEKTKIMLVSETEGFSQKTLLLMRTWIDVIPFLKHLRPRKAERRHRDNGEMFDVGPCTPVPAASVAAYGIGGQVTGNRGTLIVVDDIETRNNTITVKQRQDLAANVIELEFMDIEDLEVVFLGTPHHEETVYDTLIERGYKHITVPIMYPTASQIEKIPNIAPQIMNDLATGRAKAGMSIDPVRHSEESIQELMMRTGRTRFYQQMMCMRGLTAGLVHPLRQSDLIVFDISRNKAPAEVVWGTTGPKGSTAINDDSIPVVGLHGDNLYAPIMVDEAWYPVTDTKAFLDPAGSGDDELAWHIASQLHGYIYSKYSGAISGRGSKATTENFIKIVESLRRHGVRELIIEKNGGGELYQPLLEPIIRQMSYAPLSDKDSSLLHSEEYPDGWSCSITLVHHSKQKEKRIIETLEPVMNQHRLVVSRQVAADTVLMHQLVMVTEQKNSLDHDDRLDAMAGVVAAFKDLLAQDAATQAAQMEKDARERKILEYFAKFSKDETPYDKKTWGNTAHKTIYY